MAVTQLDIFNRALAEIGHNRVLSAGDTTKIEYIRCLAAWEGSRKAVLSAHEWNWLVAETTLTEGAYCEEDGAHNGMYYWSRPDTYLRIMDVVGEDGRRVDYTVANQLIYAEVPYIRYRYLPDSEDPADWPVYVVDAVAFEIAARISIPMTASGKTMVAMKQLASSSMARAIANDAAEQRRAGSRGDKYVRARR